MAAAVPMESPRSSHSSYLPDIHPQTHMAYPMDIFPEDDNYSQQESLYRGTASASNCIVSPRGLFRVFRYYTFEGGGEVPIIVTLNFSYKPSETTYLRLVVGRRALNTTVRQMARTGTWELEAIVPPLDDHHQQSTVLPITAQALTDTNGLLDAVTVGSYTYWAATRSSTSPVARRSMEGNTHDNVRPHLASPSLNHSYRSSSTTSNDRSTASPSMANMPTSRTRTTSMRSSSTRSRSTKIINPLRLGKKQALMRTRRYGSGEDLPESHRAVLELKTPLDSMCTGWNDEELKIGRRLVRFKRAQEGYCVKLSCESIKQEEYSEGDTVISCIYRRDTDSCYVTSVDIIFLLETIVGDGFEIEEKNRIRRNLEGFRPKTISKNRAGSEGFFQQIMDFSAPKPRNIEKDVKVFEWSVLSQALEKIVSKYSLYYSTDREDLSNPPSSSGSDVPPLKASPEMTPLYPSSGTTSSDSRDHHERNQRLRRSAEMYGDVRSGNISYGSLPSQSMSRPFLPHSKTYESYNSMMDPSPSLLPHPPGAHEPAQIPYHAAYQLMPSSQTSLTGDICTPPVTVFADEDDYLLLDDRIRSPMSYF